MNWFQAGKDQIEAFFDVEQTLSEDENVLRSKAAIDCFHNLFLELTSQLRIQDNWSDGYCDIAPFSTGITEKSLASGMKITLGVSYEGWFVESGIRDFYDIRYMKDGFWKYILKLSSIGKAVFNSGGCSYGSPLSEEARSLTKNNGSLVFSIARDYALLIASGDERSGLGSVKITAPLKSTESDLIEFYRSAVECFYKSNQLLYKSALLRKERILKKYRDQDSPRLQ